jgi:hypothetical protein
MDCPSELVHHRRVGGQKHEAGPTAPRLTEQVGTAKLRLRLCIEVDENLRCRSWAVEGRLYRGKRLSAAVKPLADEPFPTALKQALDELLRQHREVVGPFDPPYVDGDLVNPAGP